MNINIIVSALPFKNLPIQKFAHSSFSIRCMQAPLYRICNGKVPAICQSLSLQLRLTYLFPISTVVVKLFLHHQSWQEFTQPLPHLKSPRNRRQLFSICRNIIFAPSDYTDIINTFFWIYPVIKYNGIQYCVISFCQSHWNSISWRITFEYRQNINSLINFQINLHEFQFLWFKVKKNWNSTWNTNTICWINAKNCYWSIFENHVNP